MCSYDDSKYLTYGFELTWNRSSKSVVTCIQASSPECSGEFSGDRMGGGRGWINLGTITNPLPTTNIAPALFAVPVYKSIDVLFLDYPRLQT